VKECSHDGILRQDADQSVERCYPNPLTGLEDVPLLQSYNANVMMCVEDLRWEWWDGLQR